MRDETGGDIGVNFGKWKKEEKKANMETNKTNMDLTLKLTILNKYNSLNISQKTKQKNGKVSP